jgi:N-acylneuraminate cytidylyltransferase
MTARLALVLARGGSTRVPRKNVRDFLGRPALARVVEAVMASGAVDEVVVSTDDDEVRAVAEAAGAVVPFRRPAELADAFTGVRPVIQHAIRAMAWPLAARLLVTYPTAVLARPQDFAASAEMLDESVDFVMAVAEYPAPVERALAMDTDGLVTLRDASRAAARSQDLERSYHDVGQVYWGTVRAWLSEVPVAAARTRGYVVDRWRAVDIDTPDDWRMAELAFQVLAADD